MVRPLFIFLIAAVIIISGLYFIDNTRNSYGPVGDRGRAMLNGAYFGIQFEIDSMPGVGPKPDALNRLSGFVFAHTGKAALYEQSQISSYAATQACIIPPCPPASSSGYTLDQIVSIMNAERNSFPVPGTLSVWILFADRPSSDGAQVGAESFCATCIVVFQAGGQTDAIIQGIILAHEFGHLLGLCAISYPDVRAHCDGTGHSTNPNDLMYYKPNLSDPNVQALRLDANDLADLQDLRTGAL